MYYLFRCATKNFSVITFSAGLTAAVKYIPSSVLSYETYNETLHWRVLFQGGAAYTHTSYENAVCRDLECVDPFISDVCISLQADDNTSCGYKKVTWPK